MVKWSSQCVRVGVQLFKDITGGSHPEAPGWEIPVKCKNQSNLYMTFLSFCFFVFFCFWAEENSNGLHS